MSNPLVQVQRKLDDLNQMVSVLRTDKDILEKQIEVLISEKQRHEEGFRKASVLLKEWQRKNSEEAERLIDFKNKLIMERQSIDERNKASLMFESEIKFKWEELVNFSEKTRIETDKQLQIFNDIKAGLEFDIGTLKSKRDIFNDELQSTFQEVSRSRVSLNETLDQEKEAQLQYANTLDNIIREIDSLSTERDNVYKELEDGKSINESIRLEFNNKKNELDTQSANLLTLKKRFQDQLHLYFPHLNVKL